MPTFPRIPMLLMVVVVASWLSACTTIPAPLEGEYSEFYPDQAIDRSTGANVRWGGTIVRTLPQQDQTCIEILARQLDVQYRPEYTDRTFGRFLACREVFMDPEVFENDRAVTIVGRIEGFQAEPIGDFDYNYPVVQAKAIYLWPEYANYWGPVTYPYPWYYPRYRYYPRVWWY
ncbi:MAG: Slp family lipoprotein [Pseudomonadota bacterium]